MSLLSVIIPTFNAAKTIGACLDSIAGQTFNDLEVLCMDGNSTDDTVQIIKKYAGKYPFIRFISEKDQGIYDAMNKGIKLAKGEWLYFLGSDDTLFANTILENVSASLKTFRGSVIYGNVNSPVYGEKYDGEFDVQKIESKNIAHQAIFYRKNLFSKIGLYDLKYVMLADWDFNLRWMNKPKIKRKYVDLTIANYAAGGKSDTVHDTVFYADLYLLKERYGYRKKSAEAQLRAFIKKIIKTIFG